MQRVGGQQLFLLNLVSNAVRHAERGGVAVGRRQRGRELRIDVYDTGDCISEDKRVRVGPRATVTIAQRILPLTRSLLSMY